MAEELQQNGMKWQTSFYRKTGYKLTKVEMDKHEG
jgi:hypothetical protein